MPLIIGRVDLTETLKRQLHRAWNSEHVDRYDPREDVLGVAGEIVCMKERRQNARTNDSRARTRAQLRRRIFLCDRSRYKGGGDGGRASRGRPAALRFPYPLRRFSADGRRVAPANRASRQKWTFPSTR